MWSSIGLIVVEINRPYRRGDSGVGFQSALTYICKWLWISIGFFTTTTVDTKRCCRNIRNEWMNSLCEISTQIVKLLPGPQIRRLNSFALLFYLIVLLHVGSIVIDVSMWDWCNICTFDRECDRVINLLSDTSHGVVCSTFEVVVHIRPNFVVDC